MGHRREAISLQPQLVITIRCGPELKSVGEALVLLILHGLNSAHPYLISTNQPETPLTVFPVHPSFTRFFIQRHVYLLYTY